MADFDSAGPLPRGTTVLEASAGTGKTYAIVAVAVRYLAAGVPVSRLLLATFSKAASAELRDRLRARLRDTVAALAEPALARESDDGVIALLARGDEEQVALRRARLVAALSDFDAATVATTHTFCNRMLAALGFLGEREQDFPIVEGVDELVEELARDLYLRSFAGAPSTDLGYAEAAGIAKVAVRHPAAALAPVRDGERSEGSDLRVGLAQAVRTRTTARKRAARLRTYDDLQDTLHRIVTDPLIGPRACARIAAKFSVVLIDEFQDTDPQQWDIVRRCFHEQRDAAGERIPLILVGDPKQAIYAFRGAEVLSYQAAVAVADQRMRLVVNWRSDGDVVRAVGRMFAHAELGEGIGVHPVRANRDGSRLAGAPALRIRRFGHDDFTAFDQQRRLPLVAGVRDAVIADVAADIAATLNSGLRLDDGSGSHDSDDTGDSDRGGRPVVPGDIAVLVRKNAVIEPLQAALRELGVPSVITSGTSVFRTPAAADWWYVLAAISQPSKIGRVRLAALTPLLGLTAADLDAAGESGAGDLAGRLADLGRVFADSGFAALAARLLQRFDTQERLLAAAGGERRLTDVLQVADVCNSHVAETGCGLAALVAWLGEQITETSHVAQRGDATRRLDRDGRVVQLMTVHAAKGLEFPIVYVPFGWDGGRRSEESTFLFHEADGRRFLDVGGPDAPGHQRREALARHEWSDEELRLLYVAMTRASSQVVLWWAPSWVTEQGALHRLLATATRRTEAAVRGERCPIPDSVAVPDDDGAVGMLRAVADGDPAIALERTGEHGVGTPWRAPGIGDEAPDLGVATFGRTIDRTWRRTSYSAIVAEAHRRGLGEPVPFPEPPAVEGTGDGLADEPAEPPGAEAGAELPGAELSDPGETSRPGTPSPMNGLPFGAAFGTLVHDVLEHVDTSAPDPYAEVYARCAEGARQRAADIDVEVLAHALVGVLTTPLGFGDLWSIAPRDRLAELDFELPLGRLRLDQVGELLARHLPDGDPLRGYAGEIAAVSAETYRGFLIGSIDSVLRRPDGRFTIVDYKTNRLRPGDLVVEDFGTAAMADEMRHADYPLQALLYAVALHRYLAWRMPGYSPETHLGPVQYHFVRGMAGPATPPGCGVFEWRLPPALVAELSELISGGAPE